MKEFEVWFKKNKPYERYSCMDMAEKAWKAALEWVLKNGKPYYDIDDEKVVAADSDIIYKELGE